MSQVTVFVQGLQAIDASSAIKLVCGGSKSVPGCDSLLCMVGTAQEAVTTTESVPEPIKEPPKPGSIVPLCSTENKCPAGCCDAGTGLCRRGTGEQYCGRAGELCIACGDAQTCSENACVSVAQSPTTVR